MVEPRDMDAEGPGSKGTEEEEKKKDAMGQKDKKKKKKEEEAELSEEDAQLKENLELMVQRLADVDQGVVNLALVTLMYVGRDARVHYEARRHSLSSAAGGPPPARPGPRGAPRSPRE